jgi:hypothetical protein
MDQAGKIQLLMTAQLSAMMQVPTQLKRINEEKFFIDYIV